jgi:hypothetical protein
LGLAGIVEQNNLLGRPAALEAPQGASPPDIDVSGNYWGTTSGGQIALFVLDCIDPGQRQCVITFPFETSPIAAAPMIDRCSSGQL